MQVVLYNGCKMIVVDDYYLVHIIRKLTVIKVARWCNGKTFGLAISRSQVQILPRQRCVTTLGKLFTPMCLCYQAV